MTQSVEELGLPSPKERRRLREAAALTHEQVAAAVGVAPATVRSWETGRTDPRGRKREVYARFLRSLAPPEPVRPKHSHVPQDGAGRGAPPRPAGSPRASAGGGQGRAKAAAKRAAKPASDRTRHAPATTADGTGHGGPPAAQAAVHLKGAEGAEGAEGAVLEGEAALRTEAGARGCVHPAEPAAKPAAEPAAPPAAGPAAEPVPPPSAQSHPQPPSGSAADSTAGSAAGASGASRPGPSPEAPAARAPGGAAGTVAEPVAGPVSEPVAGPAVVDPAPAEAEAEACAEPSAEAVAEEAAEEAAAGRAAEEGAAAVAPAVPAAGAAAAFDALYDRAAPALTRQAYLLTSSRALAHHAVERAFQHAWARWPEVAVDPDPVGWVRAAAYEYALSPWHRLRRSHRSPDPQDKLPAEPADRILLDAMLTLPPAHRRTVLLYDGVGLDLPDTAAETEASTPTTALRLLHAHEELSDLIPELVDVAPEKQSALLHDRFGSLRPAVRLEPRPAVEVRVAGENRARRWTRAVLGLTAVIAVATTYTVTTAPTAYAPPPAPGSSVSGVPPLSGPPRLTEQSRQLQEKLRSDPAASGPGRLVPMGA
ncbi:RNA polymerase sigma factor [Streptomyces sp. cmx-4-9]|uniref:RNA polymerase sigma factor n=1 Tax=Streptomyces sp. cmx-4-9 TaxID=2790941 RepID=UPI00397EFD6B